MAIIDKISVKNVSYDLGASSENITYDSNNTVKDIIDNLGTAAQADATDFIASTSKGAINGVAELDSSGKVPSAQLPSGTVPVILSGTLAIGETTVTITDANIHTDSYIDTYTDVYGVNPTDITNTEGSITLTFEAQENVVNIRVWVF